MVAAFPTLTVEVAFTTAPTSTPTWTDVTAYVLAIKIRRGRDNEFGPMQMGTAEVVFDNSDRRFDPSYAAGPYYLNLKPMRRIRISAAGTATPLPGWDLPYEGPIFHGYIDGWPQSWLDGVVPIVSVRVCDAFKVLGMVDLNATYPQELSGLRINRVLDNCGWTLGGTWVLDSVSNSQLGTTTVLGPSGDRVLADGDSLIIAQTVTNANAVQYLNDVTNSEYGMLFANVYGQIEFHNRHYWLGAAAGATFNDTPGGMTYSEYGLEFNDEYVYNDVRMQRVDGTPQAVADNNSQLAYFKRTLQDDRLLITTDSEVSDRTYYLLARYKDPRYRSREFGFSRNDTGMTTAVGVGAELGDRIIVVRHPQGGAAINIEYVIEGIEQEIGVRGQSWDIRLQLSPVDNRTYWLLAGSATDDYAYYSFLGGTTRLSY